MNKDKKNRKKKTKKKTSRNSILIKVSVVVFVVYIAFVVVQQNISIKEKQEQLRQLNQEIAIQQLYNEEMKAVLESGEQNCDEYIEKKAREKLDYSFSDEQVFIGIAGN